MVPRVEHLGAELNVAALRERDLLEDREIPIVLAGTVERAHSAGSKIERLSGQTGTRRTSGTERSSAEPRGNRSAGRYGRKTIGTLRPPSIRCGVRGGRAGSGERRPTVKRGQTVDRPL